MSVNLPNNLYAILQSFLTLATTLNLSRTTRALQITRQSVRRHIVQMEELAGTKLFSYRNNQFSLTADGIRWQREVELVLEQTRMLFDAPTSLIDGMPTVNLTLPGDDNYFYAQQHPIVRIWDETAVPLIREGFEAWSLGASSLEHPAMQGIRPYLVVYRQLKEDWVYTEIGEKSSYASWLRSSLSRSAVGRTYLDDILNTKADRFLLLAHTSVSRTGTPWYGHVSTKLPREKMGDLVPVNYQRLVLPCHFPDRSPAIAVLIARTNRIDIAGLDPADYLRMPPKELMEFEI
ncbi:MAG: LysR family transcriptional regulator [Pseudomonadota bacterium]